MTQFTNLSKLIRLAGLAVAALISIAACSNNTETNKMDPISSISIDSILNTGSLEFKVKTNQNIVINANSSSISWQASLGRIDIKAAKFTLFDNNEQNILQFIEPGRYQIILTSHQTGGAPNIMKHTLVAVVE
ncbi:hypothetical protein [Aliikangiella coralliicola]|uniref:Uncharacterized protein n=1 Tax=Aliikangiella coralliicola TaxID=2592383 RepID=A0A545UH06_9GAMM|nr:hypothetical protein [Aliikangiella coralliicola]TQV88754.1 hypothetical protein FLL46_04275 [Aliikangiella coralliicola]